MKGHVLILLACLLSTQAHAGEIYKCTSESGAVSFQALPCSADQTIDKVKVQTPSSGGFEAPQPISTQPSAAELGERIEQIRSDTTARQESVMDEYYEQKCERYKGYLADAESRWDRQRRQGYKQWEKDYYEGLIEKREREKDLACG